MAAGLLVNAGSSLTFCAVEAPDIRCRREGPKQLAGRKWVGECHSQLAAAVAADCCDWMEAVQESTALCQERLFPEAGVKSAQERCSGKGRHSPGCNPRGCTGLPCLQWFEGAMVHNTPQLANS